MYFHNTSKNKHCIRIEKKSIEYPDDYSSII